LYVFRVAVVERAETLYGLCLRARLLFGAGFLVCTVGGVVVGFASVALLVGFDAASVFGWFTVAGGVLWVAPVRVVAGALTGSTAPPDATHALQPPSSGRTFVNP
jgi:hypothetical protein